jgi:site-specific DNA-adenine methylase
MRTPFGYFGDKWRSAPSIWQRLGNPTYYYEPFAGVLGCLLRRPTPGRYEYVGDIDAHITNFWRAAKWAKPEELAQWADWPHNSLDLKARLKWLRGQKTRLKRSLVADPHWYDPKCAGWYAWVNSVRMHNKGTALHLMRPKGVRRRGQALPGYFRELAERLKNVTVYFGDWTHLVNSAATASKRGHCAILLDPPYEGVREQLYDHHDRTLSAKCRQFALAAASPRLRIALCGYEGEPGMPEDWEELAWGSQTGKGRERIWFSPHCLRPTPSSAPSGARLLAV